MNKQKRTAIIFGVIAVLITLFIFYNSAKPAAESSEMSVGIVEAIIDAAENIGISLDSETLTFIIRKLAHFAEYFLLGICSAKAISCFGHKKTFLAILFCLAVSVCDEFVIQALTDGRSPEIRDCIIDLCGATVGTSTVYFIKSKKKKKKRR